MEKEKINLVHNLKSLTTFIKNNFIPLVALLLIFQLLEWIHTLPYINIVSNYQLYEIVIIAAVVWMFFYTYVTNRGILITAMLSFLLAIPATILKIDVISEILGFISFILLCIMLLQRIYRERKILRNVHTKNSHV